MMSNSRYCAPNIYLPYIDGLYSPWFMIKFKGKNKLYIDGRHTFNTYSQILFATPDNILISLSRPRNYDKRTTTNSDAVSM